MSDLTLKEKLDISTPFLWKTSGDEFVAPEDMKTRHLFFTLRMIWNHSAPDELKLKPYTKHRFGPYYNAIYMKKAIKYLLREVMKRKDINPSWEAQLNYMISNARATLLTE